jgi:hypothetical protein
MDTNITNIGDRYGMLVVTRLSPGAGTFACCICDCGLGLYVVSRSMRKGWTTSCGCNKGKAITAKKIKDITGKVTGRLTVIGRTDTIGNGGMVWECLCECGNTTFVPTSNLNGNTLSCGCFREEVRGANIRIHGLWKTKEYRDEINKRARIAKAERRVQWADAQAIKDFYANTPEGMTVDHVIPYRGELVSGLHVENNLQYLSLADNCRKGAQFEPIYSCALNK